MPDERAEVAHVPPLSAAELKVRYERVFGRPARSTHRAFLERRLAWKVQERRLGGLPEEASRRLRELAERIDPLAEAVARARRRPAPAGGAPGAAGDSRQGNVADRSRPGATSASRRGAEATQHRHRRRASRPAGRDLRLPAPGTILRRVYKGQAIVVRVLERGFEYEGRRFRSLSGIAKEVTGAHWNGMLFFQLTRQGR